MRAVPARRDQEKPEARRRHEFMERGPATPGHGTVRYPTQPYGFLAVPYPGGRPCSGSAMVSDSTILEACQKPFQRLRLASLVTAIDDRLRLRLGVIEYTQSPDCLFRIQPAMSDHALTLRDGTQVRLGDPIVHLHVWNEQFPPFSSSGPTLAWARRVNRAFEQSLCELADFLNARQDLRDVIAICGDLTLEPSWRSAQLTRFVARFGFERIAAPQSWSFSRRAHWLGQNILISMMVLAHNAGALRADTFWRDRVPVFLSRRALDERYGTRQGELPKQARLRDGSSSKQQRPAMP
jgi:hypothetical protein